MYSMHGDKLLPHKLSDSKRSKSNPDAKKKCPIKESAVIIWIVISILQLL